MAILFVGQNGSLKNGTDACRDTYRNFIFGSTKFTAKAINDSLTIRIVVSLPGNWCQTPRSPMTGYFTSQYMCFVVT